MAVTAETSTGDTDTAASSRPRAFAWLRGLPLVGRAADWGLGPSAVSRRTEAAEALDAGQAALVAVGEPTIAEGVERAIIRSAKTFKHDMNIATDELAKEMTDALKQTETAARS